MREPKSQLNLTCFALFTLLFLSSNEVLNAQDITLENFKAANDSTLEQLNDSIEYARKSNRKLRRLKKISLRDERKNRHKSKAEMRKAQNRDLRFISRRVGRRVWELEFDFLDRTVKTSTSLEDLSAHFAAVVDTNLQKPIGYPPIELHEYDGISVKFVNVNPFIYNVNVTEVQSDRIASQSLSSSERTVSAQFDVPEISSLRLISTFGASDAELDKLMRKKETEQSNLNEIKDDLKEQRADLVEDSLSLNKMWRDSTFRPTYQSFNIQALDSVQENNRRDSLAMRIKKYKEDLGVIKQLEEDLITAENTLKTTTDSVNEMVQEKMVNLEEAQLPTKQNGDTAKQKLAATSYLTIFQLKVDSLRNDLKEINNFVTFHHQVLSIANSPVNIADSMRNELEDLKNEYYKGKNIAQILKEIKEKESVIEARISSIKGDIILIQSFSQNLSSRTNYSLGLIQSETDFVLDQIKKLDLNEMIARIRDIDELIIDSNFMIVQKSMNISENADFIYLDFNFVQKPSVGIPKGKGDFNFNIGFNVREGVKIDISPCILFESGVIADSYFFETDNQEPGTALVQKGDRSPTSLGASALLNVYKRSSSNFKLGGSVGFGISKNFDARFSIGPSLIMGRTDRVVVSAGAIFGIEERPEDGFEANETVQINEDLLQSGVPLIRDGIATGFYVAVGFNLFGEDTKSFFQNGISFF